MRLNSAFKLAPLALTLILSCAYADTAQSGLETSGFDTSVRAQDDLFHAINGNWIKHTEIPADKSRWGSFMILRDLSDQRVHDLADALVHQHPKSGSEAQQIRDFYASFLDTGHLDQLGSAPIQPELDRIAAIHDRQTLARYLGEAQAHLSLPINLSVSADDREPTINRAGAAQGGLGLPDRDYYLKKDNARMAAARSAYHAYLSTLAALDGQPEPDQAADRVMALEAELAEQHWSKVDNRDPVKRYNPMTQDALAQSAPGLDWKLLLKAAHLDGADKIIVSQPSAITGAARLLAERPLDDWKLYLRLHALDHAAQTLPWPYRQAHFAFHGAALTGAKQPLPRWQQAAVELDRSVGFAVGQRYVAQYFPPEHKARMEALVANLFAAYKSSINDLSWMSPETKAKAQEKLSKYTIKIAYPSHWRNYQGLVVRAGDALGNRMRSEAYEWARDAAKLGKPVDKTEWHMTPQTVNAYYEATYNEIVFPAAILQPPFFNAAADDAVNYGGIGAVIGHEISHGFDDKGSQFDGDGRLNNWWTAADRQAFDALTSQLAAQFDAYEALPGAHVNGKLTLGENIADLSGLQIAYKAYKRSLQGRPAPVIDGLTGEQRFFMGFAQVWREKMRDEARLQQVTTDPHSPGEFRANGAAINHDGFHDAFGTKPGDGMYKPSEARIRLW
ncbi:MAG: M13 family metallopeptidase [Burkholderiaceae bacterium]|nr:M13 family metallopeptidase [Burkholderiaceae bacterium]